MKNNQKFENPDIEKLAHMVATGFGKVDDDIHELRNEMHAGFAQVDERFEKLDSRLSGLERRIDVLADAVAPVKTLEKFITEDFMGRMQRLEEHAFGAHN
jgi:hypothetical protein